MPIENETPRERRERQARLRTARRADEVVKFELQENADTIGNHALAGLVGILRERRHPALTTRRKELAPMLQTALLEATEEYFKSTNRGLTLREAVLFNELVNAPDDEPTFVTRLTPERVKRCAEGICHLAVTSVLKRLYHSS